MRQWETPFGHDWDILEAEARALRWVLETYALPEEKRSEK